MHRLAMHRISIVCFSSVVGLWACGHPLPPPVAKTMPAASTSASGSAVPLGEVGPVVRLGFVEDHLAFGDDVMLADGAKDYGFRIRISGEVLGWSLTSSDTKGNPIPGACWDTYVGATPMPKVLGLTAATGDVTAGLAVLDAKGTLLNPQGTFPAHTFHDEYVTIWCPDPGNGVFHEGRAFTLLVLRPGNRVDRSTVMIV